MVRLLVRLEGGELVRVDHDIVPVDIELAVGVLALGDSPAHHLLGHLADQRILSFC